MSQISRRDFGKAFGAAGLATLGAPALAPFAIAQGAAKVVIVGGGAGGASVAVALKRGDPKFDITLIEGNRSYSASFFSNLYLGEFLPLSSLNHGYDGLQKLGINVVLSRATDVDSDKRTVKVQGGRTFAYDKLVLSPGIDVKYDSIAGYSPEVSATIPQAYTTDAAQKSILKRQLEAMRDGGVVVMAMPNNPYRCPPAPYERACMIAHYLKTKKPKSKLVILDPKKGFAMRPVFTEAFDQYYNGMIELNLTTEIDDFAPARVDPKTKEIEIKSGKRWKGDVINVIPQQRAGEIAHKAGCAEGDWCPIKPENFASTKSANIYVIGDATVADPMPKSAFSANSQAKVVAAAILADFAKTERLPARYSNTCWALVAPDNLIKFSANYAPVDGKINESDTSFSRRGESPEVRKQNYADSVRWYAGITADMFAKTVPAEPTK